MAHDGVSSRRPLVSVTYTHNTLAGGVHFPVAPPDEVSWRQKNRRRIQYEYRKRRQGLREQERDKRRQLLSLFASLALALTIGASNAKAQIVGDLRVKVPFEFHAGNSDFPAGEYRIRSVDNSGLDVMQISTMDGSRSGLFQ